MKPKWERLSYHYWVLQGVAMACRESDRLWHVYYSAHGIHTAHPTLRAAKAAVERARRKR